MLYFTWLSSSRPISLGMTSHNEFKSIAAACMSFSQIPQQTLVVLRLSDVTSVG